MYKPQVTPAMTVQGPYDILSVRSSEKLTRTGNQRESVCVYISIIIMTPFLTGYINYYEVVQQITLGG